MNNFKDQKECSKKIGKSISIEKKRKKNTKRKEELRKLCNLKKMEMSIWKLNLRMKKSKS
jgi:hypothetical protein